MGAVLEENDVSLDPIGQVPEGKNHLATVIFVHGFRSDHRSAWSLHPKDDSTFWPSWISQMYPGIKVLNVNYPTAPGKAGESVYGHVKTVRSLLDSDVSIAEKPILFVCHSMGGLIVKHLMATDELTPEFRRNVNGVAFFSTPHKGSPVATGLVRLLGGIFLRPEIMDLHQNSSYIHFLHQVYLERMNSHDEHWEHIAFCEKKRTIGLYVVPLESAKLTKEGESAKHKDIELPRDHAEICKFRNPKDVAFKSFVKFLEAVLDEKVTTNKSNPPDNIGGRKWNWAPLERFFASLSGILVACFVFFLASQGGFPETIDYLIQNGLFVIVLVTTTVLLSSLNAFVLFRSSSPWINLGAGVGWILIFRVAVGPV